jgi:hypothetical protein
VRKIHSDYVTLKEFTEDVAQTKMEFLLQDAKLDTSQAEAIVGNRGSGSFKQTESIFIVVGKK